jgi:hypothetical protein
MPLDSVVNALIKAHHENIARIRAHHEKTALIARIKIYAPQTKILEGGTKDEIQMFD